MIRRYESAALFMQNDKTVGDKPLRRHITKRAAKQYAKSCCYSPSVVGCSLESVLDGAAIFVDPIVRDRKTNKVVWHEHL